MKRACGVWWLTGGLCLWAAGSMGQEKGSGGERGRDAAGREERVRARAEREKQFRGTLSNSVLDGVWQMTTFEGERAKGPLSEPKAEKYTIAGVSKASGDYWVISARIEYADKDVTIPVTVRVVWAGDTPIITLDKMALPGLGTYSARVMVYRGFYSGTWFGTNYGGVLSGQIVKQEEKKKMATTQPSGKDD